jgi:hypothetical protein
MPSDAYSLSYVESSIPEGMTLAEYRRQRMQRQPKPARKGPRWFPLPRVRPAFA